MTRIALLCSEPLRPRMAGIGIRYLEFARHLMRPGIQVVLMTAGSPEDVPEVPLEPSDVRRFERGRLPELLADCDGAVAQGQLANDLLLELPDFPTAIDLYDPWLVENLHYTATLGIAPYRNDHASWVLQLSRGDFFLCSSEEQRQYYLGFLTALGRVNPELVAKDPDLQSLIAPVPFGIPDSLPPHQQLLGGPRAGEKRLLFGGLYDWYDPWTLLQALEKLEELDWTLFFVRNPNWKSTPQQLFGEVQAWCRRRKWWGTRVVALDWTSAERRYDLLRDVDVLVAPHRLSLETRLSLRTRFLDALATGCPVITSEGGALSRLLTEWRAGWVVPPRDPAALAEALLQVFDANEVESRRDGARELAAHFSWERVLQPLVRFCREPACDPTKDDFAFSPPTLSRADTTLERLRRRWHSLKTRLRRNRR